MLKTVFRFFMILVIIVIAIIIVYILTHSQLDAVDKHDQSPIYITVEDEETPTHLFNSLEQEDIIRNADAALDYCIQISCKLTSGQYQVMRSMSANEIIDYLQDESNVEEGTFLEINSGDDLKFLAQELSLITDFREQDYLYSWNDTTNLESNIATYWYLSSEILSGDIRYPLEGYFPPHTYKIDDTMTVEEITTMFLDQGLVTYASYKDLSAPNSYSFHQAITMASLVQEEQENQEERPNVAQVYYNRINDPTFGYLNSDKSVLYALDENKETPTYEDLELDNKYNTYFYPGLTPGPISSVDNVSLDAVYYPEKNDYYYFFIDQDLETHYAKTEEENNENICTYEPDNIIC